MAVLKKSYRIEETLATDITKLAGELKQSENQVVETALKMYRDYQYMQVKSSFISAELVNIIQASYRVAENGINQKTNRVLTELAVQTAIQNCILAQSLEVSKKDLHTYRLRALDYLRENNRVFKMNELVDNE